MSLRYRVQSCSALTNGVSCAGSLQTNCLTLNVFVLLDYNFGRLNEATWLVTTLHRAAESVASHCTGLHAVPKGWSKLLDVRVTSRQVMFVCLVKGTTTWMAALCVFLSVTCHHLTLIKWNRVPVDGTKEHVGSSGKVPLILTLTLDWRAW
jgi:hypothetical protein